MARFKDGILGGFSGKVGPVVGVNTSNGYYMRSLPRKRTKFTEKELINQAKFKLVQDYLKPIKPVLVAGFKDYYTKTGGYRAAIAYTRKHALAEDDNGFYINPALFRMSGGTLHPALNPQVIVGQDKTLTITWEQTTPKTGLADQLLLLVYDSEKLEGFSEIYQGAYRESGTFSIEIPQKFSGKPMDIYIGFIAADRSGQSDSQYLGRITLS